MIIDHLDNFKGGGLGAPVFLMGPEYYAKTFANIVIATTLRGRARLHCGARASARMTIAHMNGGPLFATKGQTI